MSQLNYDKYDKMEKYNDFENKNNLNCARCRVKPAIYTCNKCEPLINFCTQCDNYVHMNSKMTHKREVIQTNIFQNSNNNNIGGNYEIKNQTEQIGDEKSNSMKKEEGDQHTYNFNYELAKPNQSQHQFKTLNVHKYVGNTQEGNFITTNTSKYINDLNASHNTSNERILKYERCEKKYERSIEKPNERSIERLNKSKNEGTYEFSRERPSEKNYERWNERSIEGSNYDRTNDITSNLGSPLQNMTIEEQSLKKFQNDNNVNNGTNKLKSFTYNNDSVNRCYMLNSINNSNSNNSFIGNNSKDYINEIKNVYDKEKQELLYKISCLQTTLDQVKSNMSEKIKSLEMKLEETIAASNLNIQIIEDEHKLRIKRIFSEKDIEIKTHLFKIDDLERCNHDLKTKVNDDQKTSNDIKNFYNNIIDEIEYKLKMKEKEYLDLKISYDNKINYSSSNFEDEKVKIIKNYEETIEKLAKTHKESKEKLNIIIYQKETEIKNLMDKYTEEERITQNTITELRKELHSKVELCDKLSTKKEHLKNDIENLEKELDKTKKDTHFIMKEVKTLESENKKYIQDNQELKMNSEKLNGMIFGKMKSKPHKNSTKNVTKNNIESVK